MKLHEYQAKDILSRFGLPVQPGGLAENVAAAERTAGEIGLPVVIKAQVLAGGRGKAGGVKIARTAEEVKKIAAQILGLKIKGLTVKKILLAGALEFDQEYYLGITLDRSTKSNVLIFSEAGGVEIEEVAKTQPENIHKFQITNDKLQTIPKLKIPNELIQKLLEAYLASDATLAEINPLVRTKTGKFIALDAKIIIDDNALYRQQELAAFQESADEDPLEAEARQRQVAYVRLPGSIGIIGNGAGLVMTTMDEVKRAGGEPACFLDLGGGSKAAAVASCLELLAKDQNIKGLFFNIFGGITRCDEVVNGIIAAHDKIGVKVPVVIRLTGTREEEGKKLLAQTNFLTSAASMTEGAIKIVELTR